MRPRAGVSRPFRDVRQRALACTRRSGHGRECTGLQRKREATKHPFGVGKVLYLGAGTVGKPEVLDEQLAADGEGSGGGLHEGWLRVGEALVLDAKDVVVRRKTCGKLVRLRLERGELRHEAREDAEQKQQGGCLHMESAQSEVDDSGKGEQRTQLKPERSARLMSCVRNGVAHYGATQRGEEFDVSVFGVVGLHGFQVVKVLLRSCEDFADTFCKILATCARAADRAALQEHKRGARAPGRRR